MCACDFESDLEVDFESDFERNFEVTLGLTTKEELIKDLSVNPYIRDMKYV